MFLLWHPWLTTTNLLYVSYSWNFRHRLVRYYWYYTHVFFQFSIPSLQMEVKQLQTLQAHSLAIPNLSQLHVCYGVMHREKLFQACCCRKNKRERERKKDCGVVPERRRRTHDHIDAVYALVYLFKTELWAYHVKRSELTYTYDTYKIHIMLNSGICRIYQLSSAVFNLFYVHW